MALFDYSDPDSYVSRLRQRRSDVLRRVIVAISGTIGRCNIVDVGGESAYWLQLFGEAWLRENDVHITLVNLTLEYVGDPPPDLFRIAVGDACALPYKANAFDLAHSNSVIEHVGSWPRQRQFACEMQRVAPTHYLQTPAKSFPLEPHVRVPLFQFMPSALRVLLLQHFALGTYPRVSHARAQEIDRELRLLTRAEVVRLFDQSALHREKLFGLTKSYMVVGSQGA